MLTPVEIKKTKRLLILAELPSGAAVSGIGITFLTGYFLSIKAGNAQIALLGAIPAACSLAAIFGGWLLGHTRNWRNWIILLLLLFFSGHILLGLMPALFPDMGMSFRIRSALVILTCAYACLKIQEVFWYSWASRIIPDGQRGSFFGKLLITATLVGIPCVYFIGKALDKYPGQKSFETVFVICGITGLLAGIVYTRTPRVKPPAESGAQSILSQILIVSKDAIFRRFLFFVLTYTLASALCGPFISVYMIDVLKIPFKTIAIFGIFQSTAFILFSMIWGYLVDKYGSKPVLFINCVPLAGVLLLWIFNTPSNYYLAGIIHVLNGMILAGVAVSLHNQIMRFSSLENQAAYQTMYQVVVGALGFCAPMIGGAILSMLKGKSMTAFGMELGPFHLLFLIAALAALIPLFFIKRLNEPHGRKASSVLRSIVAANPFMVALRLFTYHRSLDENSRLHAIAGLGHTRSPVVVSELINTLDDPNYFVRREAALSLGRIKDTEAIGPLLVKLADELANIQQESAWSLGNIRAVESIAPLIECLNGKDLKLRGYAAMALGEIGASAAIEPLMHLLEKSNDLFEITSAASALSLLGYQKALWKTLEKLVSSEQPLARRQLTVSLADLIGKHGDFYRLLTREERVYGEGVGNILGKTSRKIDKKWRDGLCDEQYRLVKDNVRNIEKYYNEKQYADVLREVVALCSGLFGPQLHKYMEIQEKGITVIREILSQNISGGKVISWEESLVSVYIFELVFNSVKY